MYNIKVQLLRIVDFSDFPGWVEFNLIDAWGNSHLFCDKIPVVTCENIDLDSSFPRDGFLRCELLEEWTDDKGRKIVTVSTENPDHVDSVDGVNKFDLLPGQPTE